MIKGEFGVEGTDKEAVNDVVLSDDIKFENNISKDAVKLVIAQAVDSVVTTVKAALETLLSADNIKVEDVDANYYDISFKAGENVVKLESGKVQITFAWETSKSADTHNVKVYHYNNDKLEAVTAEATAEGIKIEADSFSPYVVVYTAKPAAPDTADTNPIMIYVMLCAAMLVVCGVVSKKRYA